MTAPLVIGHRGAPGYRPEHTRSSYELAIASGVDSVEPDVVVSKDGVLIVRHENEIGSTTDVAQHPEFASRRTTKVVDGEELTGWFAEDFTWDELATLRCRERLPELRAASAAFDDTEPMLRLRDLVELVKAEARGRGSAVGLVVEIKHATFFAARGWHLDALVHDELKGVTDVPLVIESFESTVLDRLRARGLDARYVYLLAAEGRPADLVAQLGDAAPTYAETVSPSGLDRLVGRYDGISVDKNMILERAGLVADAHERGLRVYTWTCRPENHFLAPEFRDGAETAAFGRYEAEWAVIRDAGVDGVFVDHPDLGVRFFRENQPPLCSGHDFRGIVARDVRRSFGSVDAVRSVTLRADPGRVTGLVGPNGAGKTTLLLMLASLLQPDAGEIRISDVDPVAEPQRARALLGWMPDTLGAWPALTVRETLVVTAKLYGMPRADAEARAEALLHELDLVPLAESAARVLSRGQKQRLALARALVHDPRVLLLDEPASGLDPQARVDLRVLLRRLASQGRSILVSSHVLSELEEVIDDAVFMVDGSTVGADRVARAAYRARSWRIRLVAGPGSGGAPTGAEVARVASALGRDATTVVADRRDLLVAFSADAEAATALRALIEAGVPVLEFAPATGDLEHTFLDLKEPRA